jgi:phosphohistidine phosphatase
MRRLILFRHAKAEASSRTGEDIDRPLTERGVEDAGRVGRALAGAGFAPDIALVSDARRTVQTWQAASAAFPGAAVEFERGLYNADSVALLAAAEAAAGETVMVIAHNPGMHQLVATLARDSDDFARAVRGFPTAAAAVFEREAPRSFRLLQLFYPQDYGGGPT